MAKSRSYREYKRKGRSLQRQRALDILFEADAKDLIHSQLLDLLQQRKSISPAQQPIQSYGAQIVETYAQWADDVDSMIEAASPAWALQRMNLVDRNLLRIGATEIMYLEVDLPIVVKEIASLARDFSTDNAVPFTMGILNRINEIRQLETSGADETIESALAAANGAQFMQAEQVNQAALGAETAQTMQAEQAVQGTLIAPTDDLASQESESESIYERELEN